MQNNTPRGAAASIILKQLQAPTFSDYEIEKLKTHAAAVMEIVYGVNRYRRTLQWFLAALVKKKPPLHLEAILLCALYQLVYLDNEPDHAVVHEAVELCKKWRHGNQANFINGVLREFLRQKDKLQNKLAKKSLPLRLSHPDELYKRWLNQFGAETTEKIMQWNNQRADTCIRLCLHKTTMRSYLLELAAQSIVAQPHPYAPESFLTIPHGIKITDLPGYTEGLFVVQDPATSLSVQLLAPQPGETVLDLCAAPGGKTILIAEKMARKGTLIAMDVNSHRLTRLRENAERLCWSGFIKIKQYDASQPIKPLEPEFDAILADVPCSNTGVIRRRPEVRWNFNTEQLHQLNTLQKELLTNSAALLKQGGRLCYSTCSIEEEENRLLVDSWLAEHQEFMLVEAKLLVPGVSGTDGAFVAVLQKARE